MITIIDALHSLKPNASWILRGDDYSGLEWKDKNQTKPSQTDISNEINRLQAEYDAKEYQRLRAPEYPSIQDQLDMQYHDAVNGTTTWQDAINAVKAKYPKPE